MFVVREGDAERFSPDDALDRLTQLPKGGEGEVPGSVPGQHVCSLSEKVCQKLHMATPRKCPQQARRDPAGERTQASPQAEDEESEIRSGCRNRKCRH